MAYFKLLTQNVTRDAEEDYNKFPSPLVVFGP
jgi:hypothetical protein